MYFKIEIKITKTLGYYETIFGQIDSRHHQISPGQSRGGKKNVIAENY